MTISRKFRAGMTRLVILAAVAWFGAAARMEAAPYVTRTPDRVEIGTAACRAVFARDADGRFALSVDARQGAAWRPVFAGAQPLIGGSSFGLEPTEVRQTSAPGAPAAITLGGHHATPGFDWDIAVDAEADARPLHLRITLHLTQQVVLAGLEPQAALWMDGVAADPVRIDQGPGNIYLGTALAQWGNSFPAAYLWADGIEVAMLVNPEPMTWMGPRSLFRFHDCRVQSWDEGGRTAMGWRVVKRNFHELGPGEVVFDGWLHVTAGTDRPATRLAALDRLVRLLEPLHPSRAAPLLDRVSQQPATWTELAAGTERDLMRRGVVWDDLDLPPEAPWQDGPAFPERVVTRLRVSTDYAVGSPCDPAQARPNVLAGWDFSTCNNYLSAFLAAERSRPNPEQRAFLSEKIRGVPLFYDPRAGLLRHGTRQPAHVGDREMVWQNLMFAVETARVHRLMRTEDFDPAVGGRFLMSLPSLMDLARRCGDVLPQWFNPYERVPLPQGDMPELGVVYEPWQFGTYAWLMTEAHAMTGDSAYRDEACRVLDRLLGGTLKFQVANARYTVDYDDPVEFPITEIFGNAWGMAAAARLAQGAAPAEAEHWRQASDAFLNSLARMTYWYESATAGDARDQAVRQAGLLRNHGGAMTGSPWENSEAVLAMMVRLRTEAEPRLLLLRLLNLQRVNAMSYFPRCLPDAAQAGPTVTGHAAGSLPIEDAYTLEHGGRHGAGGLAAYMSDIAMWYALLFERWATADDPAVMVVNLDAPVGFEAAVTSEQRCFLAYRPPGQAAPSTRLRFPDLAAGTYRVQVRDAGGTRLDRPATHDELATGLEVALAADAWARIELSRQAEPTADTPAQRERARDRLAVAYRVLQEAAAGPAHDRLGAAKGEYTQALAALRQGRWAESIALSEQAIAAVR